MREKTVLLIIDDDADIHLIVSRFLQGIVDIVLSTVSPIEGIRIAQEQQPDIVLLDIHMPEMNGFEVCRKLKETEATRDTQIVFFTIEKDVSLIAKALETGGTDYIKKPFKRIELLARIGVALRTKRLIDLLKQHASLDALTGLKNRRVFDESVNAAVSIFNRLQQPFAMLMFDLDHFKVINDSYGHGIGDMVLRQVGRVIADNCRSYDICCRYGGEEFAVILPHIERQHAVTTGNRILEKIREIVVYHGKTKIKVTASAGLAYTPDGQGSMIDVEWIVKQADAALYKAKSAGRDRLCEVTEQTVIVCASDDTV